jgi:hypothetical protein
LEVGQLVYVYLMRLVGGHIFGFFLDGLNSKLENKYDKLYLFSKS